MPLNSCVDKKFYYIVYIVTEVKLSPWVFFSLTFIESGAKNFLFSTWQGKIVLFQNFISEPIFLSFDILLLLRWQISGLLTSLSDELNSAKVAMTENS